ncbi:TPA: hypothetical protein ENS27_19605, partial [bacterium]|nr:hypothetical protein [bacterium]
MKIKSYIIFILILLVLNLSINSVLALSQPDTTIISGPNGNISYNDVTFWWTGKTTISDDSERLPSIKGFYYSLDGEAWNWTQDRYITYYNLSNGEHRFYVKSADSNDQQDISPAFRIFTIDNKPISEPDEGKIIFSAPLVEYQGDLNNKSISTKLRQEFSFKGISLSTNAVVSIITKDIEWHITDANKAYYIKKEDENIGAYGPVNDSEAIAMSIPVNKSIICESFNAKDGVDEDWFRIKIERDAQTLLMPRQLGIMFKRLDKSITSVIKLYRFPDTSSGKEIASIEAKDKGYFATGVTPGEYLIHVKPTTESVASTYNLTITTDTLTSTIAWDTEANNNLNNATETSPIFLSKFYPWIDIVGNK